MHSRPHGQVAAGLGSWRTLGLDRLLAAQPPRRRELAVPLIVAHMVAPLQQQTLGLRLERIPCRISANGRWIQ